VRGIRFERWSAALPLEPSATADAVLAAYSNDIERLKRDEGYQACDVINVGPSTPDLEGVRRKFLSEHRHDDDEVRYFVEGSGMFWFHPEAGPVFRVTCEKGEFISVPKRTRHWFDFGKVPVCEVQIDSEPV